MNSEPANGEDGGQKDGGQGASGPQPRRFGVLNPETFAPFRYRDFRVLWLMVFVRSAALWLETVARPVLIVELTGSAFLLGAVLAAYMAPTLLLAPIAGIIIDRYPHRAVLVGALMANIISSGILFVLLLLDLAEGWQVILLAVVSGCSTGFFHPARRAMLPNMVEQSHLRAAMALSQTGQTSMRIGGALMAGLLLLFADFTWIFGIMTALNASSAVMVLLIRTREEPHEPEPGAARSLWRQTTAGARWAIESRWPLAVIGISAVLFIFLQPYEGVMVPLIVIEELGQHRSWVGYLVAVGGIGATLGSVLIASMTEIRSPNALMVGIIVIGGIALTVLSQAPHLALVAICVFFASACVNNMVSVANLALLAHAPANMRGQALTLMNLVLGTILIGALLAGTLADTLGARLGLLTMGVCLLACALLALSTPRVRWWLWRRQTYAAVSKEDWLRLSDDDR